MPDMQNSVQKNVQILIVLLSMLFTFAALIQSARATTPGMKETWIINGNPSETQFKKWKSIRGPTELRVLLNSKPNLLMNDLRAFFPQVGRLQVGFAQYPTAPQLDAWKSVLAQGNVDLISTSGIPPTAAQVEVLNQLGAERVIFILGRYLEKSESNIFMNAKFKYSLSFNLNRYPQFLEKFPIAALPANIPVQIVADYWPHYVQMDIWNMIPQTEKRLRIRKSIVSPGNLPYLHNMKDLKELVFETDGDVMPLQWERLAQIPVRWIAQGAVPSDKSLKGFYDSLHFGAPRKLVLDRDEPLSDLEEKRLLNSKLDVEWIHAAP